MMTQEQVSAFELRIPELGAAAPGARALVDDVRRLQKQQSAYKLAGGEALCDMATERDKLKDEVVGLQESLAECASYTRQILHSEKLSDRVRRRLQIVIEIAHAALSPADYQSNEPETKPSKPQLPPNRIIREDSAKPEGET